jgi:two-component system OmpR family sensor kinase
MTLSLRARLAIGLVAVVLGGLLVADVVTYLTLQGLVQDRVDRQLATSRYPAFSDLGLDEQGHNHPADRPPPPGFSTYEALVLDDGTVVTSRAPGGSAGPTLQTPLSSQPANTPQTWGDYRVLVTPLNTTPSTFVVVAIPLTEMTQTMETLVLLEASVGAGVLIVMALLTLVIVRIGLRPLERMGQTAEAIARGDLTRRVSPATPGTEIGRLGLALNGMLSQIESAFAERTRSEQRLRRFLADASHELRTPLTSIRGYAELLRRGAERSPTDSALARRRIEEEATRMSVLVDDMLLLARLDQGRPLERERVDLQSIARDARADASAVAPGRVVSLAAPEPVVVTGDDMRLRQVVGNLVRNALVHTPPATPIEIGLSRRDGRAVLTVADHGPGLPPETAARAFEPFTRGDAGRSRDRGGAGLGLSIVAAVVAAHDGQVHVRETPGGGATFEVELPVVAPPISS